MLKQLGTALTVVLGCAVLTACSGGEHAVAPSANEATSATAAATATTVATPQSYPTVAPPPTPWPAVDVANLRPCQADELDTQLGSSSATGGQLWAYITLRNASASDCGLFGFADVSLLDAGGTAMPLTVTKGTAGPAVVLRASTPALRQRSAEPGQGYLSFWWYTHDPATACGDPSPQASTILVQLPRSGGVLRLVVSEGDFGQPGLAPCNHRIGVQAFGEVEQ